jgi:hypothetical protein
MRQTTAESARTMPVSIPQGARSEPLSGGGVDAPAVSVVVCVVTGILLRVFTVKGEGLRIAA